MCDKVTDSNFTELCLLILSITGRAILTFNPVFFQDAYQNHKALWSFDSARAQAWQETD